MNEACPRKSQVWKRFFFDDCLSGLRGISIFGGRCGHPQGSNSDPGGRIIREFMIECSFLCGYIALLSRTGGSCVQMGEAIELPIVPRHRDHSRSSM